MDLTAILETIQEIAGLATQATAAEADVQKAYDSIKNLMAKDPKVVTQADLDKIAAENDALYDKIQQPLSPEEN